VVTTIFLSTHNNHNILSPNEKDKQKTYFLKCIIIMKAPKACRHVLTLNSCITSCIGPVLLNGSRSLGIHIHPSTKYDRANNW